MPTIVDIRKGLLHPSSPCALIAAFKLNGSAGTTPKSEARRDLSFEIVEGLRL